METHVNAIEQQASMAYRWGEHRWYLIDVAERHAVWHISPIVSQGNSYTDITAARSAYWGAIVDAILIEGDRLAVAIVGDVELVIAADGPHPHIAERGPEFHLAHPCETHREALTRWLERVTQNIHALTEES